MQPSIGEPRWDSFLNLLFDFFKELWQKFYLLRSCATGWFCSIFEKKRPFQSQFPRLLKIDFVLKLEPVAVVQSTCDFLAVTFCFAFFFG